MIIIGLTGAAFAGKDTVGHYLADMHEFERKAFADPIREALKGAFGLNSSHFALERKELVVEWIGQSPRQLMQTLGTEWGRAKVAGDIWCRAMEQRIAIARRLHVEAIAITDVRFPEEAALIRRLGGQVWRIVRPGAETTTHCGHASETAARGIEAEVTLINDGTLEQLYEKVDAAIEASMAGDAA